MRRSDTRPARAAIEPGTYSARFDEMKSGHKTKRSEYYFTLEGDRKVSVSLVDIREPSEKASLDAAGPRDACKITVEQSKAGPTLVGYEPL
jgi:hypothetical protein